MYKQIVRYLSHASISFAIGSIFSTIIFITLTRSGFLHSYNSVTGSYEPYFNFGNFVVDFYTIVLIIYSIAPLFSIIGLFIAWRNPLRKLSSIWIILLAIFILICAVIIFYAWLFAIAMAIHFTTGDISPT